jgi:hypothetical protein
MARFLNLMCLVVACRAWTEWVISEAGGETKVNQCVHEKGEYVLAVDRAIDEYVESFGHKKEFNMDMTSIYYGLASLVGVDILVLLFRRVFTLKFSPFCV